MNQLTAKEIFTELIESKHGAIRKTKQLFKVNKEVYSEELRRCRERYKKRANRQTENTNENLLVLLEAQKE